MNLKMEIRIRQEQVYRNSIKGRQVKNWHHVVSFTIASYERDKNRYDYPIEDFPLSTEQMRVDSAIAHLERIVNGYEGESGALLYVNDDNNLVKQLANIIVNEGKENILLTYYDSNRNGYYLTRGYPDTIDK